MFVEFLKKQIFLVKRYILDSVAGFVIIGFLFVLIYLGYGVTTNNYFAQDGKEALIISYIFWVLSISAFQTVADSIIEESREGTIQTLFMSKHNIVYLMIMRTLAGAVLDMILIYIMLFFCCLVTNTFFHINIIVLTLILAVSFTGFWGIGFLIGGVAILHRKVENLSQILTFLFMGIMIIPLNASRILMLIPGVAGRQFLNLLITEGGLQSLDVTDYVLFSGGNLFLMIAGIVWFERCIKRAMDKGCIGYI